MSAVYDHPSEWWYSGKIQMLDAMNDTSRTRAPKVGIGWRRTARDAELSACIPGTVPRAVLSPPAERRSRFMICAFPMCSHYLARHIRSVTEELTETVPRRWLATATALVAWASSADQLRPPVIVRRKQTSPQ